MIILAAMLTYLVINLLIAIPLVWFGMALTDAFIVGMALMWCGIWLASTFSGPAPCDSQEEQP